MRHINVHIFVTITLIYTLLLIAEFILLLLKKFNPSESFVELKSRIRSWWVMVTIFTMAITFNKSISIIFLSIVSYLSLKEYFSIIPTRRADRRVLFWAYITIPLQYYFAYIGWYGMFIIFIPVYTFLLIPCRMIINGKTDNFLNAVGTIHWGLMTTVYCVSHASYLLSLKSSQYIELPAGNAGLLLFLILLTQINDVAQYVFGKLLGTNKITPTISPGKTTIGFLGGVLTTIFVSLIVSKYLTPFNNLFAAIIGCLIAISGFIGDVNISAVKRDIGIKDTGDLIPGHGGILDRIDSLTFTAPLFFHYVNYFYF